MITNKGKEIVAKYLLGTAPSFASYIAIGCGPKPRPNVYQIVSASSSGTTVTCASTDGLWLGAALVSVVAGTGSLASGTLVTEITSSTQFKVNFAPTISLSGATVLIEADMNKQSLDFEMFRVPITSRGYIKDNGVDKLVFTGELPTEERYEISEIGIFSAASNTNAGAYDSKTILAFSESETWKYGDGTSLFTPVSIVSTLTPGALNIITTSDDVFQTSADNPTFLNLNRSSRYEGARYLNNMFVMRGNTSLITGNPGQFTTAINPKYLQLSGQSFNFNRNSSADLLKIAFSLISVDGDSIIVPDNINIIVEFSSSDTTQFAKFQAQISGASQQFTENRYFVASKRFDELIYSPTFSWDAMSIAKIYVSVTDTIAATNISAADGNVTLTTAPHGIPVDSTVTGVSTLAGIITYTAANTFSPGDIVNTSGISSVPANVFNLSNLVVTEATASSFKVANVATGAYTSGGSAKMSQTQINFVHGTSSYTGTQLVTSVPSSTSLVYPVLGASLVSTPLSPSGAVDISRPEYFVSIDAIRLDNINSVNPLYGMTGYSLVQNTDALTIKKNPNTNNYIEFRVNIGVQ